MGVCHSKEAISPATTNASNSGGNEKARQHDKPENASATDPAQIVSSGPSTEGDNKESQLSEKAVGGDEKHLSDTQALKMSQVAPASVDTAADAESEDAAQTSVELAAQKGVTEVLQLMRLHSDEAAYQWWSCDALYSLCAGQPDRRSELYAQKGLNDILNAMKLFQWNADVQMKACSILQAMAADYSEHIGKAGGVEAVVEAMKTCFDSYQVQVAGVRALQTLVDNDRDNLLRAHSMGAGDGLRATLESNAEDGQLQYRGHQLLSVLESISDDEISRVQTLASSRTNPWSKLRAAVFAGRAREIAVGNIPGVHGVSGQVADCLRKEGVTGVLRMLVERMRSVEAVEWCLDALAASAQEDVANRETIVRQNGIKKSVLAAARHVWRDNVQFKAFWLWTAMAVDQAELMGDSGVIQAVVDGMIKCETDYPTQSQGVKALQALLNHNNNREVAIEAGVEVVVRRALENNNEDGELQWRGMQTLEKLKTGSSADVESKIIKKTRSAAGMEAMRAAVKHTSSQHSMRTDSLAATTHPIDEDNADDSKSHSSHSSVSSTKDSAQGCTDRPGNDADVDKLDSAHSESTDDDITENDVSHSAAHQLGISNEVDSDEHVSQDENEVKHNDNPNDLVPDESSSSVNKQSSNEDTGLQDSGANGSDSKEHDHTANVSDGDGARSQVDGNDCTEHHDYSTGERNLNDLNTGTIEAVGSHNKSGADQSEFETQTKTCSPLPEADESVKEGTYHDKISTESTTEQPSDHANVATDTDVGDAVLHPENDDQLKAAEGEGAPKQPPVSEDNSTTL